MHRLSHLAAALSVLAFVVLFMFLLQYMFANLGEPRAMWLMDMIGVEHSGGTGCYHRD